jgi:hypothetical protein
MGNDSRKARFNHFNSEFETEIGRHSTYQKAYEATEEKFKQRVGYPQYSSWDSFKNVRSRIMNKK